MFMKKVILTAMIALLLIAAMLMLLEITTNKYVITSIYFELAILLVITIYKK